MRQINGPEDFPKDEPTLGYACGELARANGCDFVVWQKGYLGIRETSEGNWGDWLVNDGGIWGISGVAPLGSGRPML